MRLDPLEGAFIFKHGTTHFRPRLTPGPNLLLALPLRVSPWKYRYSPRTSCKAPLRKHPRHYFPVTLTFQRSTQVLYSWAMLGCLIGSLQRIHP